MKKIKSTFVCCLLSCTMAIGVHEVSTTSSQSKIYAGMKYYTDHSDTSANYKARASACLGLGATISSACMKAALVGSGAGPVGTFVAVGAVVL